MSKNTDLISQCFYSLNSFKRHRALTLIKKEDGKSQDAQYHELKAYQCIDNLELGLRALQRELYIDKDKEEGTPIEVKEEEE